MASGTALFSLEDADEKLVKAVGRRMAEMRRDGGFTQETFASHLGISVNYVQQVESGLNLTLTGPGQSGAFVGRGDPRVARRSGESRSESRPPKKEVAPKVALCAPPTRGELAPAGQPGSSCSEADGDASRAAGSPTPDDRAPAVDGTVRCLAYDVAVAIGPPLTLEKL